jgi:hypothetical protein
MYYYTAHTNTSKKVSWTLFQNWGIKLSLCYFEEQKLCSGGFKMGVYEFSAH